MRFILSMLMISALALSLACQKASSSSTETKNEKSVEISKTEKSTETEKKAIKVDADEHDHDGEALRISLEDAKKDFDAGNVVIIDTRSETAYNNEHIKGSINVPAGDFENAYKKVPKDKKIIAYCS